LFINRRVIVLLLAALFASGVAFANELPSDANALLESMSLYQKLISEFIEQLLSRESKVRQFADLLWISLSLGLIVQNGIRFAYDGLSVGEIVGVFSLIAFTHFLMIHYDQWTLAMFDWSIGFGNGIQKAAIGHEEIWFIPKVIANITDSLSFGSISFMSKLVLVIKVTFVMILCCLLAIGSFSSILMSVHGYAIAKMIGIMFIPTLLFERLSWLFDGWFKTFMECLLYSVFIRASLCLIAVVFQSYLGGDIFDISKAQGGFVPIESSTDIIGILSLLFLGNATLFRAFQFVKTIVGGLPAASQIFNRQVRSRF